MGLEIKTSSSSGLHMTECRCEEVVNQIGYRSRLRNKTPEYKLSCREGASVFVIDRA